MLNFLPATLKGALAALLILADTLLLFPVLLAFGLIKLILPLQPVRSRCTAVLNRIAWLWIGFNNRLTDLFHDIDWQVEGVENLSPHHWYLVTCNHQSWADIPVMQYVLNGRIPLLKFFLKNELIWVPLLGVAWWALDFPFMRRYTKSQIARQPSLKSKDLETTRVACEKFRDTPVTVFNFMEGTRFTVEKHQAQQSPYRYLLRPRAGGTAFVLGAMGDMLHTMLEITIVYPEQKHGFWDYLCGRIRRVVVQVRTIEIPAHFLGMDYANDAGQRREFQGWIDDLWLAKDRRIASRLEERHPNPAGQTSATPAS